MSTRSKKPTRLAEPVPTKSHPITVHMGQETGEERYTDYNDKARVRNNRPDEVSAKVLPVHGGFVPVDDEDIYTLTTSKITCYKLLVRIAERDGFRFIFDPHAQGFCNHRILRYQDPTPIPGIQYPRGYKVLKPINTSQLDKLLRGWSKAINLITTSVKDRVFAGLQGEDGEGEKTSVEINGHTYNLSFEIAKDLDLTKVGGQGRATIRALGMLLSLVRDFELSQSRGFMAAGQIVNNMDQDTDRHRVLHSIAVDGATPAGLRRVVPLDWFDPKLGSITDEQLLPLLEAPEREAFMLMMGRCMLGRQGTLLKTPDGKYTRQDQRWRQFAVWEGREGGMGRTSTLEMMTEALLHLGYNAGPIDDLTGRFGHGKTARLDFGFVDDTSTDRVINILSNDTLKTLSAGGCLKTEEKGLMAEEVTAQGVYMVATNRIEPSRLAHLDAGNISRIMACHNRTQSDKGAKAFYQEYGYTVHVDRGYRRMSKQFGVTELTLMILLLSRCADKFREYIQNESLDLVTTLNQLQKDFTRKITMSYTEGVLETFAKVCEYIHPRQVADRKFDLRLILAYLELEWADRIPQCDANLDELRHFARQASDKRLGAVKQYERFFGALLSEDGSSYPATVSHWVDAWRGYREKHDPSQAIEVYRRLAMAELDGVPLSAEDAAWQKRSQQIQTIFYSLGK